MFTRSTFSRIAIIVGLAVTIGTVSAQTVPSVRIREGANGALADLPPTITTRMSNCYSFGLPLGLGAAELRFNPNDSWDVSLKFNVTNTPTEIVSMFCGFVPGCPIPAVDSCGPEIEQYLDYHVLRGGINVQSAAAGGGFSGGASFRRIATGTMIVNDVLEIEAPGPMTLELPILVAGEVFAAETFGNPAETWGKASIEITGTAAGENINLSCRTESETFLPEQCTINITHPVPMVVGAGVSTFPINLTCKAEVDVKATSAGLFGTITGTATAGANFGNSLRIRRITGPGGSPLPSGVVVRGLYSGVILEDTRCKADLDDGTGGGTRDNAVTIDDLIYFLIQFQEGGSRADVDNGAGQGQPDGGVTIDDLLFYLVRFELGC